MKNPVLERLSRYGIRPRKDLGQHFLIDANILSAIVDRVDPQPTDVIVEFGPGLGVMTERLLDAGANVVGVELDDQMATVLRQELGSRERFDLRHTDLARVDTRQIAGDRGVSRIKLVGNLPYQLTSVVLFGLLDLGAVLDVAVFLVQREVAERIVSPPGSKQFGILSVLLQAFFDVKLEMRVKPGCFAPPPRVESAVLRLRPLEQPALHWEERAAFITLVKNVFNERRKVLRNTLKKFYALDVAALEALAKHSGVDLGARPEALPVTDFVRLLHSLPATTSSGSGELS
jgi:16S rRNA (adenine1518-N6/adenine1519-N6)-dimethyltransferase